MKENLRFTKRLSIEVRHAKDGAQTLGRITAIRTKENFNEFERGDLVLHFAFQKFLELAAWGSMKTLNNFTNLPLPELQRVLALGSQREFLRNNPRLGRLGGRDSRVRQIVVALREHWQRGWADFVDECYGIESQYARSTVYEALKQICP